MDNEQLLDNEEWLKDDDGHIVDPLANEYDQMEDDYSGEITEVEESEL
jgi:hypothetical protein